MVIFWCDLVMFHILFSYHPIPPCNNVVLWARALQDFFSQSKEEIHERICLTALVVLVIDWSCFLLVNFPLAFVFKDWSKPACSILFGIHELPAQKCLVGKIAPQSEWKRQCRINPSENERRRQKDSSNWISSISLPRFTGATPIFDVVNCPAFFFPLFFGAINITFHGPILHRSFD